LELNRPVATPVRLWAVDPVVRSFVHPLECFIGGGIGTPKLREALRQVLVTRQAVLVSRTKTINELKSLIVVAPEHCGHNYEDPP